MTDWSTRIPAAIAKAEVDPRLGLPFGDATFTAGEVALAEALWAWEFDLVADEDGRIPGGKLWPSAALREFVEKMEGLDG